MTFIMKRLLVFSLCMSLISALAFDAPLATQVWKGFQLEPQGWIPKPTEAPSMGELRQRQNTQNILLASDATCGYVSGISASPFGLCCSTCTCGFATTPGYYGAFYCCNTAICASRIPTTCIDNNGFSVSSACNSKCASDTVTLKCTASPYVYCNLAEFEGVNVQALFCDSVTISHTQSIYTTYAGEVGKILSTFTGFPGSTSSSISLSAPSSSSSSSGPSSSSTSSSPSHSPTTSTIQSQTIIVPYQTSSTSPATPTNSSSPAPIGAIVGGSVGGVAVIAIIGVLIFFFFRSRGRKNDAPHDQVGPTHYVPPKPETQSPERYTAVVQQMPAYPSAQQGDVVQQYTRQAYGGYYADHQQQQQQQGASAQQGDVVQQYPLQAYGGYYVDHQQQQQQQGAYQQAQYPRQDNRSSQQSQPYPQQYPQQHDASQQVEAQYNQHVPTMPGRVELQSVAQNLATTYGGSVAGRWAPRGAESGPGGRYEVQGQ